MSAHVSTEKTDSEWMGLVDSSPILSQKTKTSYKKQLRGVISKFGVSGPVALSYIMMHPDATVVVNAMKAIPDTSLRTYVAAILSLFKRGEEAHLFSRSSPHIIDSYRKWSEKLQTSAKKYTSRLDNNEPSAKEVESHAKISDWEDALIESYDEDPYSQKTLLLAFHALVLPPLRGGDLSAVKIGYHPSGNCIYKVHGQHWILRIRDHKTSQFHGDLTRTLSSKMGSMLENYLSNAPSEREWLFSTQSGTPYSDSGFSSWKSGIFKEAFGRNVNSNSLRHEYISSMDRQHQSISQARHIASQMGHGLHVQRQYVRFGKAGFGC